MNRLLTLSAAVAVAASLTSCSSDRDPQVDMCQMVVANLMQSSHLKWTESNRVEHGDKGMEVSLAFARGDNSGAATCYYTSEIDEDELEQGDYAASPYKVILNDSEVDRKILINATLNASKGIITEAAQEASDNIQEMAEQAGDLAHDAAGKARDMANDAAGKARELAHDAAEKAQRALEQ
ncbi:MAG: hypothetical protein V3W04_02190 [Gammaproteobacteria bacterium]